MKQNIACVFLNGDPPKKNIINAVLKQCAVVVCADGAANYLKKYNIIPSVILGDLDSIALSVLRYYQIRTKIVKIEDQETTDYEKTLQYCHNIGITTVYVLGFSGQADHTWGNYSVMKKYYNALSLSMIDNSYAVSFIRYKTSFHYKRGEIISLLAFPKAKNIVTRGLRYPLRHETLELGVRDGTRNIAQTPRVTISFESGDLLLFKKHFI